MIVRNGLMKRTHVNFVIDFLAFAGFLALMSTGLLLQFRLPQGSGSVHGVGSGNRSDWRPITTLWDWTRHDWGQVHIWIAALLLVVLTAHIVLHRKWIVSVVRGTKTEASGWRFALGVSSALGLLLLAAIPLFAPTEVTTRGEFQANASEAAVPAIEVRGSMTVAEAAQVAGLTTEELLDNLDLPAGELPDERLGPLLRRYGKRVSDVNELLGSKRDGESPKHFVQ